MARLLHELSGRPSRLAESSAPDLMATLTPDQLFGHERGAFTGADRSTKGLFGEQRRRSRRARRSA
ncbi:MAG: sigma 54-interacting transcriptional regulator [Gemmatimonadales bacterium]